MPALTPWLEAVTKAIRSIPKGETASYSRVALMAGKPGAARAVVRALHSVRDVPWWRVVRADGTLAVEVAEEQARRLRAEGVAVEGRRLRPAEAKPRRGTALRGQHHERLPEKSDLRRAGARRG